MPQRDSAPVGAPCWIDLLTSDPDAARAFYSDIFGWTAEDAGEEYGGYVNFAKDGLPVAGCMRNDGTTGAPDAWTVYLASEDAKATTDAAVAHGGQVLLPAMDVKDLGVMAMVADPGGAAVGVWQPGTHTGFRVLGEPGTPNWFELHTRDVPTFRYTTLGEGDGQLAGVMDASAFLPEGVPAHWSVYVGVEDADATLARIGELGGSTVQPAEDTPFGRLAQAADPTGALFKLVGPTG